MLKLIHILSVILLLGNLIVGAVWRWFAQRSSEQQIHKFSLKVLQKNDLIFTLPTILLIGITGHMLAPKFGGIAAHGWIYHSYAFLTVATLIWAMGIIPLQRKQFKLINEAHSLKEAGIRYQTLSRWWSIMLVIVVILTLVALYLMVTHPMA